MISRVWIFFLLTLLGICVLSALFADFDFVESAYDKHVNSKQLAKIPSGQIIASKQRLVQLFTGRIVLALFVTFISLAILAVVASVLYINTRPTVAESEEEDMSNIAQDTTPTSNGWPRIYALILMLILFALFLCGVTVFWTKRTSDINRKYLDREEKPGWFVPIPADHKQLFKMATTGDNQHWPDPDVSVTVLGYKKLLGLARIFDEVVHEYTLLLTDSANEQNCHGR